MKRHHPKHLYLGISAEFPLWIKELQNFLAKILHIAEGGCKGMDQRGIVCAMAAWFATANDAKNVTYLLIR
jgi:hypothetical protein